MRKAASARGFRLPPWIALAPLGLLQLAATAAGLDRLFAKESEGFVLSALFQGALYLTAIWSISRPDATKGAVPIILIVAFALRAVALPASPFLSTDAYRYVWDGRVQAAEVNPYRYLPNDPALAPLRDDTIYPNVNRKDYAPTIYPPAAQLVFLVATRFGESLLTIKLAMVAFEAATIAALMLLLRRRGQPSARVIIYAWHPLPVWEFAGTGHIDAAAIAFLCLALLAAEGKRPGLAGAALAAGALVKPFPVAVAPALWRRWDWKMPAAAILTVALLYAPYLGVGSKVLGFLTGYGDEEGYSEGGGFYLVALLRTIGAPTLSGLNYLIGALLIYGALAATIAFRARPEALRARDPIVLCSTFLILTSPHYAWYFAWAIPFLCAELYLPLLYMTLAAFMIYLPRTTFLGSRFVVDSVIYGGFVALALAELAVRSARAKGEAYVGRERAN